MRPHKIAVRVADEDVDAIGRDALCCQPIGSLELVRFGRPSVRGISTEVLWGHADSGEDARELAEAFDLTVSEVQWALAYENAQRAA